MTTLLERGAGLDAAATRATAYLLGMQDAGGAWRDFLLPAGLSDAWVTAYAALALAETGGPREVAAARRGWVFLEAHQATGGGWAYNDKVPADADSTLWALRLARALGEAGSPAALRAVPFLDAHLRPDGGLATYAEAAPIRAYTGAPAFVPFDGWTQSHVCVSAPGAHLPAYAAGIARYLLARQEADGAWSAYFWFDRDYATAEAVCALAAADRPAHNGAIGRARAWLTRRVENLCDGPKSGAFALACSAGALATVAGADQGRLLAHAGETLAAWQRANGSWGPTARLRVPPPNAITPPDTEAWPRWEGRIAEAATPFERLAATFTNHSPDHRGIFGAATVLRALRRIDRRRA